MLPTESCRVAGDICRCLITEVQYRMLGDLLEAFRAETMQWAVGCWDPSEQVVVADVQNFSDVGKSPKQEQRRLNLKLRIKNQ